jgi:hypothetical protein
LLLTGIIRFLKKVVLEDMAERCEVEKIRIIRGSLLENGDRMDVIRSKFLGEAIVMNTVTAKQEWRWRLVPEEHRAEAWKQQRKADADKKQAKLQAKITKRMGKRKLHEESSPFSGPIQREEVEAQKVLSPNTFDRTMETKKSRDGKELFGLKRNT